MRPSGQRSPTFCLTVQRLPLACLYFVFSQFFQNFLFSFPLHNFSTNKKAKETASHAQCASHPQPTHRPFFGNRHQAQSSLSHRPKLC